MLHFRYVHFHLPWCCVPERVLCGVYMDDRDQRVIWMIRKACICSCGTTLLSKRSSHFPLTIVLTQLTFHRWSMLTSLGHLYVHVDMYLKGVIFARCD